MNKFFSFKKARTWAIVNTFQQFANMAEMSPLIRKIRKQTDVIRDVPYLPDAGPAHLLDVYQPKDRSGPLPVMLYIHGGGFTICSKETHRSVALLFAHFGFVVFNINYRLAPKYPYPAALEDACHAYKWVVGHAAEYGGDKNRLSVAGESAGANLVLGLTIAACYERPEPFAKMVRETGIRPASSQIIAGLLQVSNPDRFSQLRSANNRTMNDMSEGILRDVGRAYLGRPYKNHQIETMMADPLVFLETAGGPVDPLPPIFAAVGTADILLDDTRRLERALQGKTDLAETRYYPDEPHVFHFVHWKKHTRRFWKDCRQFLARHAL